LGRRGSGSNAPPNVELRIGDELFGEIRQHVEDWSDGEQGAFILCGHAKAGGTDILLARAWQRVPAMPGTQSGRVEHGLEWTAQFSASILAKADGASAALVLVHSHGASSSPVLSATDVTTARTLFPGFSRVLKGKPSGSVVLGAHAAAGTFWQDGRPYGELSRLRIVGAPIQFWTPAAASGKRPPAKRRHARMILAIGPDSEAKLAAASVAVIGLCGGGSHVVQQLAHIGVGRLVLVDQDRVEDVNLGRMVGSRPSDAAKRIFKTRVMARMVRAIDPAVVVEQVRHAFPEPKTLAALKSTDVVVSCVDSFLVREQINVFCRRHHLPLVDIGLGIKTEGERLTTASGQLLVVTPDSPCLRCGPLLSDSVLERERRERPPGYDENPDAPGEPQVVSMNGTLASEATNTVLDLLTGYSSGKRGAGWWLYNARAGEVTRFRAAPRRSDCPACAERGFGDPS
jgi:molybdopterin/thiamine biosynthesis adenylyltransferase